MIRGEFNCLDCSRLMFVELLETMHEEDDGMPKYCSFCGSTEIIIAEDEELVDDEL